MQGDKTSMTYIKQERSALSTLDHNGSGDPAQISHAVGKKIGLSQHYTCLLLDRGAGAPVVRSRNKAIVKATRLGKGYETLLVSTKSIMLAIQESDLSHLVRGCKLLVFPYPEWRGQPRSLVECGTDESLLGGDYVVLHDVDRGIFLKVDRETVVEQAGVKTAVDAPPKDDEGASQDHRRSEVGKPLLEPGRQGPREADAQLIQPRQMAPECLGRICYFQLTAEIPRDLPMRPEKENIRDYFVRIWGILRLGSAINAIFDNFPRWTKLSSRFEVLQAARIFHHVRKNGLVGASVKQLAEQLNICLSNFSQFNTLYEKWRRTIDIQRHGQEDVQSDAWLHNDCGSISSLEKKLKAILAGPA